MERIGFAMRLLPGAGGRIPPAARRGLARDAGRAAGRRARANYSIFLRGDDLFGYLEVDDFARFQACHGRERGQRSLAGRDGRLIDPLTDPATGFHRRLDEVFHLD